MRFTLGTVLRRGRTSPTGRPGRHLSTRRWPASRWPRRRRRAAALAGATLLLAATASTAYARGFPPGPSNPGDLYVFSTDSVTLTPGTSPVAYIVLTPGTYLVDIRAIYTASNTRTMSCHWLVSAGSPLSTPTEVGSIFLTAGQAVAASFETAITITPPQGIPGGALGLSCWTGGDVKATGVVLTALRTASINVQSGP
jgi:hypothetical protein